jgi:hypothetical protein
VEMIEDIELEADEGGLFLVLQGDFTDTFEQYLKDPNQMSVKLHVSQIMLAEFEKEIKKLLYW